MQGKYSVYSFVKNINCVSISSAPGHDERALPRNRGDARGHTTPAAHQDLAIVQMPSENPSWAADLSHRWAQLRDKQVSVEDTG